ncbi:hypothetical protein [Kluyvera ascorbata]|jgi:hypothetical protein|uniref:Uncharacterized protein n=1 Tax=Siphoviridae sp. ctpLW14 TaxID=2826464 RepID=A0A8S5N9S3_9CAUD|nr:hypothetical protein [Kluyvera ascorbata]MDU3912038.1 hypothetical protein [Kluyvera ascorbata]DAD90994.1 MAG TPA: hypothetical protein [Siphoviridae sp. ctpLW14]HDG1722383.1 hypothetical protein [Kluyvera ascorbata]
MLVSELISILQESIMKSGDMEVLIKDDGYFSCESEKGTYYPPFIEPVIVKLVEDCVVHVKPDTESSRAALDEILNEVKSGPALVIGKTVDRP